MTGPYVVYRSTRAGLDEPVAEVESWSAMAALEQFAATRTIDDYSIDHGTAQRLILCPRMMRHYFYVYCQPVEIVS